MSPTTIALIRSTFALATADADALTITFYRRLFELAPSVRGLFPQDLAEQRGKLAATLTAAVSLIDKPDTLVPVLQALGRRHQKYGAAVAHYPIVGQALFDTLAARLGTAWTPAAMAAWTELYGVVAKVMSEAQQGEAQRVAALAS